MSQKELQKKKRENMGGVPRTSFFSVFRKCFPACINVFMVFFVTLSLFPTVQSGKFKTLTLHELFAFLFCASFNISFYLSDIRRVDPHFFIEETFYSSVLCFITFNVSAMIGSSLTTWIRWVIP